MKKKVAQKMFVGFGYILKDDKGNIIGYQRSSAEKIFKFHSLTEVASEDDICYIPEHIFDEQGNGIDVISLEFLRHRSGDTAMTIKDMRKATAEYFDEVYKIRLNRVDPLDKSFILDYCMQYTFDSLSGKDFADSLIRDWSEILDGIIWEKKKEKESI